MHCVQVGSTAGLAPGTWVRIYALEQYRGLAGGASVAGVGGPSSNATRPVVRRQEAPVPRNATATSRPRFMPLTPALTKASAIARLSKHSENAKHSEGVSSAAAKGSLDAYL